MVKRLLVSIVRSPARWFGSASSSVILLAIVVNVAFLQDGRHPAPLAGSPRPLDTLGAGDRVVPPLPAPRIAPEPNPERKDAIRAVRTETVLATPRPRTDDAIARVLTEAGDGLGADDAPDLELLEIQTELQTLGMYDGILDGLMGPRTRAAIALFQKRAGLPETGEGSPGLLDRLRRYEMPEPEETTAALPTGIDDLIAPGGDDEAAGPESDPRVRAIQRVLAELGYLSGPVDGVMGSDTRRAIRDFEADRGIDATGTVSDVLIRALEQFTGRPVG